MEPYKERYWTTLIQLVKAEHKDEFRESCKKSDISPSKAIGMLIERYIDATKGGY